MPIVTGNITIADLVDGVTGASIVFTDESRTFIASPEGAIATDELSSFTSTPQIYVGNAAAVYDAGTLDTNNTFRVTATQLAPSSGTDLIVTVNSTTGAITIADAGLTTTGFADANTTIDSVTITVTIEVRANGATTTYNRVIGLNKAKGGNAKIVRLTASRQTVMYPYGPGTDPIDTNDITIKATFLNFTTDDTDPSWTFSSGNAAYMPITASQGTITTVSDGIDDTDDTNNTLTITPGQYNAALGSNGVVTYRCLRTAGRFDQVTVAKLEDAAGGVQVVITSTNPTVFKNNAGDTECTATLYQGGEEVDSGRITSYQWQKDGADFVTTVQQPIGQGSTSQTVKIGASDVTDGSSHQFTCDINFT